MPVKQRINVITKGFMNKNADKVNKLLVCFDVTIFATITLAYV